MTDRITATADLTFTLLAPLHHGAGTSGNVAILREQAGINPHTGEEFQTPVVSAATVRRAIRAAAGNLTLETCGAEPGTVTKQVVDLLMLGGALTSGSSSEVLLSQHRDLDGAWPVAGLMGYATVGGLWPGSLWVDHLLPVCAENVWRLPARLAAHPHTTVPAAALMDEDFATRGVGAAADAARWAEGAWSGDPMPTEFQVLKPGTVLYGRFRLGNATVPQAALLRHIWDQIGRDGIWLGGKRARGYGHCAVDTVWPDTMPEPDPTVIHPETADPDGLMGLLAQAAGR